MIAALPARKIIDLVSVEDGSSLALDRWVSQRLDAGYSLAIINEPALALKTATLNAVSIFNPLRWGPADSEALERFFLDFVEPRADSLRGFLVPGIVGLRDHGYGLRGLPASIARKEYQRRTLGDHAVPSVSGLAGKLRRLMVERSGPWIGGALPEASQHYRLTTEGLNGAGTRLRIGCFLLSWLALVEGDARAVVLRLPAADNRISDSPLLRLINRLPVECLVTFEEQSLSDAARRWCASQIRKASTPAPVLEERRWSPPKAGPAVEKSITSDYDVATDRMHLQTAWQFMRNGSDASGIDGMTLAGFQKDLYGQLFYLDQELRSHTYEPMPLLRMYLLKANGEPRPIGIPTVRDRLVQNAVLGFLTARVDKTFLPCSFGYRPSRNAHMALVIAERNRNAGFSWVVNADIRKCFDSIDHERLFLALSTHIADRHLLHLIQKWVTAPVREDGVLLAPTGRGVPQGAPISPLLANIYLHPLDVYMIGRGHRWIRYADDILCFTRTEAEAQRALADLRGFVEGQLHLELKPGRTDITTFAAGVDFLGFTLRERSMYITPNRLDDFRSRLLRTAANEERTVPTRLARVNAQLGGFGAYFRRNEPLVVRQLTELDSWTRAVVGNVLHLPAEELGQIRSVFYRSERRTVRRDFYLDLLDLVDRGDAEPLRATTTPAPTEVSEPLAEPNEPDAAVLGAAVDEANALPDSTLEAAAAAPAEDVQESLQLDEAKSESRAIPERDMTPADHETSTSALFLSEGYAREDLREFLRLASAEDRPMLTADGTLHVGVHGCVMSKNSQHIVVRKNGASIFAAGLVSVKGIVVQAVGVTINSTLLRVLADRSIPVHFLNWKGEPYGEFTSPSKRSPAILRGQLRAFDNVTGVEVATSMLAAKCKNQLQLLRLYERYREKTDVTLAADLRRTIGAMLRNVEEIESCEGPTIDAVRGRLIAAEGRAAAAYFRAISALVGPEKGFSSRTRGRTAPDVVNGLLDYTYKLLYTRCHRALLAAGIDARIGLVHTDAERGKLSMLYDFVEEFRAIGADRPVVALLARGVTVQRNVGGKLSLPTRRKLLRAFERNLTLRCRYRDSRLPLHDIIDAQAKHLADVFAGGKTKRYRAFLYNH